MRPGVKLLPTDEEDLSRELNESLGLAGMPPHWMPGSGRAALSKLAQRLSVAFAAPYRSFFRRGISEFVEASIGIVISPAARGSSASR